MVRNEARELTEGSTQGQIESVAIIAAGGTKESAGGGVNSAIDQIGIDRDGGGRGQRTAETIAAREAKGRLEARATQGKGEEISPSTRVPRENLGGNLAMGGEIGGGGEGSGAVATGLQRNRAVEGAGGEGAPVAMRVGGGKANEAGIGLGVVPTKGGKKETVVAEGDRAAARAVEVAEDAEEGKGSGSDNVSLASPGDASQTDGVRVSGRRGISSTSGADNAGFTGGQVVKGGLKVIVATDPRRACEVTTGVALDGKGGRLRDVASVGETARGLISEVEGELRPKVAVAAAMLNLNLASVMSGVEVAAAEAAAAGGTVPKVVRRATNAALHGARESRTGEVAAEVALQVQHSDLAEEKRNVRTITGHRAVRVVAGGAEEVKGSAGGVDVGSSGSQGEGRRPGVRAGAGRRRRGRRQSRPWGARMAPPPVLAEGDGGADRAGVLTDGKPANEPAMEAGRKAADEPLDTRGGAVIREGAPATLAQNGSGADGANATASVEPADEAVMVASGNAEDKQLDAGGGLAGRERGHGARGRGRR